MIGYRGLVLWQSIVKRYTHRCNGSANQPEHKEDPETNALDKE